MKNKRTKFKPIVILVAICLLVEAIIYQRADSRQSTLVMLQEVFPVAVSYETCGGKYPAYRLYDSHQRPVGYVVMAKSSGYGGPMTVLVGINPEGKIIKTAIIQNYETPLYFEMVIREGFLDNFTGKSFSDQFTLGEDLDGVSGATVSAKGIASAVRKAAKQIGVQAFGMEESNREPIEWGVDEVILIILLCVTLLSMKLKLAKFRFVIMAFSVFFLGFKLGASINVGNIASLVSGNVPSFIEWPFWFLLVVGTLFLILVTGRNFYCSWLCPFGAVQEGIYRALSLMKINMPPIFLFYARELRLTLTWAALMVAFIFVNPSIASYEPFSAFFSGQGNMGQWLLMGLVLFLSIFFNRIWCRLFCPTGAVMDLVASVKGAFIRKLGRKDNPSAGMISRIYSTSVSDEYETAGKENPQTIFPWVFAGFIVLIIFTLCGNAGIL